MNLEDELRRRLATLRDQLIAEYGWTCCPQAVRIEPGRVIVHGEIATPRLQPRIEAALAPALPPETALLFELQPPPIRQWRQLPAAGSSLQRWHPRLGRPELCSELVAEDGPVAVITEHDGATLIRARDGTLAWFHGPPRALGKRCEPRPLTAPIAPADPGAALQAIARTYLGVPYLLGGATWRHIDCSALVQRTYYAALGLLLPRHSGDQLAVADGGEDRMVAGVRPGPGTLLFIHDQTEGRTHVGIAGQDITGASTVLQASRTRGRVVEVALADYLDDAAWLRLVRPAALLAWGHSQVGRDWVDFP